MAWADHTVIVCVYMYVYVLCMYVFVCTSLYVRMCACVCVHVCMYVSVYVNLCVRMQILVITMCIIVCMWAYSPKMLHLSLTAWRLAFQCSIQGGLVKCFVYYTVVWEKFTIGYFHVKIVRGKIFLLAWGIRQKLFNNELF